MGNFSAFIRRALCFVGDNPREPRHLDGQRTGKKPNKWDLYHKHDPEKTKHAETGG